MTDTTIDILLVSESDWQSRVIQKATGGVWNHAGIVRPDGTLVQALSRGVVASPQPYYLAATTRLLTFPVSWVDRGEGDRWLDTVIGDRYDWWNIAGFGLNLLTNGKFIVGQSGAYICSALCAAYLQFSGYPLYTDPHEVSPNDLARIHDAAQVAAA